MEPQEVLKFNPLDHPIIFSFPERLVEPASWVQHIPFAMYLIDVLRPETFVELGTHTGNSYCAFCQAIKELQLNTKAYAIDTWEGDDHAGYYGDEVYNEMLSIQTNHYHWFSTLIRSTFDDAVEKFPNGSIDLLHIDGYHTYEAVKHDFETWNPKLSNRAVVIFHDISVFDKDFGVWRFWNELKPLYQFFEFLHGKGLGIIIVGKDVPKPLRAFFESSSANLQKNLFSYLGDRLDKEMANRKIFNELFFEGQQIKSLKSQKDEKEIIITNLREKNQTMNKCVQELSEVVESRDQEIQELSESIESRDQEIQELSESIESRDQEIQELSESIESRDQEKSKLIMEINNLQIELVNYELSHSWQYTRIFRKIRMIFGRKFAK